MKLSSQPSRRLAGIAMVTALAASLSLLGCSDGPNAPGGDSNTTADPTSLSISPDSVALRVNEAMQFEATSDESTSPNLLRYGKGRGKKAVASLDVTPSEVTLARGAAARFAATAVLYDGSTSQPTVTWSATGGTIDDTGLYTAGTTLGTYQVVARANNGVADTSDVAITSTPPTATAITLSPTTTSVVAGGVREFTTVATSSTGKTVAITPVYRVTGGTITAAGEYTAGPTPGTYRVIATDSSGALADSSTVTVTSTPTTTWSLSLTPGTVSLATGARQQFTASATTSDGSTVPVSLRYTATGGTISTTGVYTAGSTPGAFRVVATDSASGRADTAAVTITAPAVATVSVTPGSADLLVGQTTQLSATVKDSSGAVLAGQTVTWSSSRTGVASVSSSGLVTGVAQGSATISATAGGKQGQTSIAVSSPPVSSGDGCPANGRVVNVSTLTQLTSAVGNAQPGDCIVLAAGTYALGSQLNINRSGTASSPIVIQGPGSGAVLDANQRGVYLQGSYVQLRKFRITDLPLTGLWLLGAHHDVIDSMEIDHSQQELLAIKYGSHHNIVRDSYFHDSGLSRGNPGEGIYIGGSMASGGCCDVTTVGNQVLRNRFERIWTESLDIKDGSDSTLMQGNVIDGSGSQFINFNAVSLIAINSNYNRVIGNTLSDGSPHGIVFFTVNVNGGTYQGSRGTLVQGNTIHLKDIHNYGGGIGVKVSSGSTAIVKCDNVVTDIPSGGEAYNVSCTP